VVIGVVVVVVGSGHHHNWLVVTFVNGPGRDIVVVTMATTVLSCRIFAESLPRTLLYGANFQSLPSIWKAIAHAASRGGLVVPPLSCGNVLLVFAS
jgi:hypothetical protein